MIGHLQRNKIKYIIDKVCMIHSIESVRLAEAVSEEAGEARAGDSGARRGQYGRRRDKIRDLSGGDGRLYQGDPSCFRIFR